MSLIYFIYVTLYVVAMVLIFVLSAMMLIPRLRIVFKAPVPHIHNIIGVGLIPWGMSYLLFLPDIYLTMNGVTWRDQAYVVVSLLTTIMCISSAAWGLTSIFQQGVRQRVLQPFVLFLPVSAMLWYAFCPDERVLGFFLAACAVDVLGLAYYVYVLYCAFVVDVKANYSSVSRKMLRCIWVQWLATAFAYVIFFIAVLQDSVWWNIIDIFSNLLVLMLFVHTSEHLIPLPGKEPEPEEASLPTAACGEEMPALDLREALARHCEERLLFCNPELSLQDLSIAVGTNRTYLSKWFMKNETTFYNYINGLRIEYAGRLLLTTDDPVVQIQLKSGFLSKTTFRKYFMERYRCTPMEYRKQERLPQT